MTASAEKLKRGAAQAETIRKDAEGQFRRTSHGVRNDGKVSAKPIAVTKDSTGDATVDTDVSDVTGRGA